MSDHVKIIEEQQTLDGDTTRVLSLPRSDVSVTESKLYEMHWEQKMTTQEIADELNTSETSVIRIFRASNIRKRTVHEANALYREQSDDPDHRDESLLRKLWEECDTLTDMANELDCSTTTVSQYLAEYGIREKQNNVNPHANYIFEYEQHKNYCYWIVEGQYIPVHYLSAIASGADPHSVFGNPKTHVHHINGHKFDNRPENLELIDASKHGRISANKDPTPYSTADILRVIQFMLNPSSTGDSTRKESPKSKRPTTDHEDHQTKHANPG